MILARLGTNIIGPSSRISCWSSTTGRFETTVTESTDCCNFQLGTAESDFFQVEKRKPVATTEGASKLLLPVLVVGLLYCCVRRRDLTNKELFSYQILHQQFTPQCYSTLGVAIIMNFCRVLPVSSLILSNPFL